MEMNDILSLAKAGFTAPQISAFMQIAQPKQIDPVVQPVQTATPVVQNVQVQPQDAIMAEIAKLTNTLQSNALLQTQQPQEQTTEDILASIINPTAKGGK